MSGGIIHETVMKRDLQLRHDAELWRWVLCRFTAAIISLPSSERMPRFAEMPTLELPPSFSDDEVMRSFGAPGTSLSNASGGGMMMARAQQQRVLEAPSGEEAERELQTQLLDPGADPVQRKRLRERERVQREWAREWAARHHFPLPLPLPLLFHSP